MEVKQCNKCKKDLPIFLFYKVTKSNTDRKVCSICNNGAILENNRKYKEEKLLSLLKENKIQCRECKEIKDISKFFKNKQHYSGFHLKCKSCSSRYKIQNKEKAENRRIFYTYGITKEQYNNFWIIQNNACAICKLPKKQMYKPCIDHCHKTKVVRGILCNHCNTALGGMKDDINNLKEAIKYLKKYNKLNMKK